MSENIKDVIAPALGELTKFEAAAFRFGHQVRAFLGDFPAGLPVPSDVMPRYDDRHSAEGDMVFGGGSYVHLIMQSEEEVEAWAEYLGVEATRQAFDTGAISVRTEGPLNGLTIYVGFTGVDRTGGGPR